MKQIVFYLVAGLVLTGCVTTQPQQQGSIEVPEIQTLISQTAAVELDADVNGGIDITKGGTNSTTAAEARTALGADNADNITAGTLAEARIHADIARDSEIDSAITTHSVLTAIDRATEIDSAITTHSSDATSIHGITDTSVLMTGATSGADGDLLCRNGATGTLSKSCTEVTLPNASIDMADLNTTGTPDGTKYLRDDGVWITPAGAGNMNTTTYDSDVDGKIDVAEAVHSDAAANIIIKMGDLIGGTKVSFQDSNGIEQASINSDGTMTFKSLDTSAADGEHFADVVNTVANTETPTSGRLDVLGDELRMANGANWTTWTFLKNTAIGSTVQAYNADLGVNAIIYSFTDTTDNTYVSPYLPVPTGSAWTTAEMYCFDASGNAATETAFEVDVFMIADITTLATPEKLNTLGDLKITTGAFRRTIDISAYTDPSASSLVRFDIATAGTADNCSISLKLTE